MSSRTGTVVTGLGDNLDQVRCRYIVWTLSMPVKYGKQEERNEAVVTSIHTGPSFGIISL